MKIPNHPVFPHTPDPDEAMDKERDEAVADELIEAAEALSEISQNRSEGVSSPGCSETPTDPKGLGRPVNKPLMRKPRGPDEVLPDRVYCRDTFSKST